MDKKELFCFLVENLERPEFKVFYSDHGFNEQCIKVRVGDYDGGLSSDLLLVPCKDKISIGCMCIFSPEHLIDCVVSKDKLLNKLRWISLNHACIPWPG